MENGDLPRLAFQNFVARAQGRAQSIELRRTVAGNELEHELFEVNQHGADIIPMLYRVMPRIVDQAWKVHNWKDFAVTDAKLAVKTVFQPRQLRMALRLA